MREAKKIAEKNIPLLAPLVSEDQPLIGIEPSAILSFRDEYPDLASDELLADARKLAAHTFTIEEFLAQEAAKGRIDKSSFTKEKRKILLHGHCQQKSISSTAPTMSLLGIPENFTVEQIPSGCCGMAGSFWDEKEHFELSQKVGELVLFPAVRNADESVWIAAPGTSCRHQVKDGTGKKALHPVEILFQSLA